MLWLGQHYGIIVFWVFWSQYNEVLNCEVKCPGLWPHPMSNLQYQYGELTHTPISLWIIYLQNWVISESVVSQVTTALKSSEPPTSLTLMLYGCHNSGLIGLPQHEAIDRVTELISNKALLKSALKSNLLIRRKRADGKCRVTSHCRQVGEALVLSEWMSYNVQ